MKKLRITAIIAVVAMIISMVNFTVYASGNVSETSLNNSSLELYTDNTAADIYAEQLPNSGGAGGGGRYDGFNIYITDTDGNMFDVEPADGTPIRLTMKAVYMGEPSVAYGMAVYNDGRLISAGILESKAEKLYESEFLEIDSLYYSYADVKLFRFENISSMKPLGQVSYSFLDHGAEYPVREDETDGIEAVKGIIVNEYEDGFDLMLTELRKHGYWGVPAPQEPVRVNYYGPEIMLNRTLGNVKYNLSKNADGTYSLVEIDYDDRVIRFAGCDIVSYTASTITILNDGAEKVYEGSEYINFKYEDLSDEYYFAYLVDGKIDLLVPYKYEADRVIGTGGGKVRLESGKIVRDIDDGYTPKVRDAVITFDCKIYRTEPMTATYIEDEAGVYVKIGDKLYSAYTAYPKDRFLNGETCIAYLDPEGSYVKHIEKIYTRDDIVVINEVESSLTETVINTNRGVITLKDDVIFNNEMYPSGEMMYIMPDMVPFAALVYEVGDVTVIDILDEMAYENMRYSSVTDSLGGYSISGAPVVAITNEGEIYGDIELKDRVYLAKLYSFDGVYVDFVMIIDVDASVVGSEKYMLVTGIDGDSIIGYVDGELVSYEANVIDVNYGDILELSVSDGNVSSYDKIIPAAENYRSFTQYMHGNNVLLPAYEVSGDVVYLCGDNGRKAVAIDSKTDIYVMNVNEGTAEPATIDDIFCSPYDYYIADWIATYYVGEVAQFIVICRE